MSMSTKSVSFEELTCDRCGRQWTDRQKSDHEGSMNMTYSEVAGGYHQVSRSIDLCTKCAKAFEDWLDYNADFPNIDVSLVVQPAKRSLNG